VVIMALLGGAGSLLGPVLGVIPLVILFDVPSANFPNYFSILLGAAFMIIVHWLPHGVLAYVQKPRPKAFASATAASPVAIAPRVAVKRPLLMVGDARKTFGGLVAVDNLSFQVNEGEIVGLIGPNGSGKTTMLNLISGALTPDSGDIRFKGVAIAG